MVAKSLTGSYTSQLSSRRCKDSTSATTSTTRVAEPVPKREEKDCLSGQHLKRRKNSN